MRRALILSLVLVVSSACATTVPFRVTHAPTGRTPSEQQLDDLQCANASRVQGPLLFGLGLAIVRSMAADRYEACMRDRGYVVVRQD